MCRNDILSIITWTKSLSKYLKSLLQIAFLGHLQVSVCSVSQPTSITEFSFVSTEYRQSWEVRAASGSTFKDVADFSQNNLIYFSLNHFSSPIFWFQIDVSFLHLCFILIIISTCLLKVNKCSRMWFKWKIVIACVPCAVLPLYNYPHLQKLFPAQIS